MNSSKLVIGIGAAAFLALMATSVAQVLGTQEDPALAAYRSGRYDEAVKALQQKIGSGQDVPHDHRHLFRALFEVGRYMEAEKVARGFINEHPESSDLHNSLGEVLWTRGHLDEAETAFQEASNRRADDWLTAELNLGIAAFERGRRTEAMQRFDRFIDFYNNGEATTSGDLTAVGIAC